jgi:hypothetical protein
MAASHAFTAFALPRGDRSPTMGAGEMPDMGHLLERRYLAVMRAVINTG